MRIYFSKISIDNILKYKEHLQNLSSNNRWVFDKDALKNQIDNWINKLPWIKPYYAIKSNPSEKILKIISNYEDKIGIDTASIQEVNIALKYTKNSNIIFTNPHTTPHEKDKLRQYLTEEITIKVVDSMCEIKKLVEYNISPNKILIRINSNFNDANVKFDSKFAI
jgi:ornithine decarboxylase